MQLSPLFCDGPSVSALGFGASPLGNVFGDVSVAAGEEAVHLAIDRGINFFDTSPYYGLNLSEQRLGSALAGRRHQVVLATKCGRYGERLFDFSAAGIKRGLDDSLRRLQTDCVDLLQVHDCEFTTVDQVVNETLPALEACRSAGKVRWIGVTGYGLLNLREIARRAVESGLRLNCVLSYCRQNLANNDLVSVLAPFAQAHGLGLINASPLHMGLLTETGPPAWHPAGPRARAAALRAGALCRSAGVRLEELALQFALASGCSVTTLVGMGTAEMVSENLRAMEAQPQTCDLMEAVRQCLREGGAAEIWPSGLPENYDPGTPTAGEEKAPS